MNTASLTKWRSCFGLLTMRNHFLVLLASLFVVSIGFGITLPVLPFYAERLAMAAGASRKTMVVHVGLLTGVFSLMQLLFAPLWGRLSDRIGRRPLVLLGMAGYGLAQPEAAGRAETSRVKGCQSAAG